MNCDEVMVTLKEEGGSSSISTTDLSHIFYKVFYRLNKLMTILKKFSVPISILKIKLLRCRIVRSHRQKYTDEIQF